LSKKVEVIMKSKNKNRKKKRDYVSIPISILFVTVIIYMLFTNISGVFPNSFWISTKKQLEPDLVCMVNNAYMGKKQIEVVVDEKKYYGCCEMCKVTLNSDSSSRYATDPFTGEIVDKSEAFIFLKAKKGDLVQYFKSKENFEKYLQNKDKAD
jgi:hypothetical protein